jgi:hypothetical protein
MLGRPFVVASTTTWSSCCHCVRFFGNLLLRVAICILRIGAMADYWLLENVWSLRSIGLPGYAACIAVL